MWHPSETQDTVMVFTSFSKDAARNLPLLLTVSSGTVQLAYWGVLVIAKFVHGR